MANNEIYFEKLFDVKIRHDYYTKGDCGDFIIIPTEDSLKTLKNFGLLFKSYENGFQVLYRAFKDGTIQPLKPIDTDIRLTFMLKPVNKYLVNFSDLPVKGMTEKIYYFDNLTLNKSAANELLLVDDTIKKYAYEKDTVFLKSTIYNYDEATGSASQDLKITDAQGVNLNPPIDETVNAIVGRVTKQFDLKKYGQGLYKLFVDGSATPFQTFYVDDKLLFEGIFGIIEIFKNSSVPADYVFANTAGVVSSKTYVLQFHRRATFWKYILVKKYNTTLPNVTLQSGATTLNGVPHSLPDGTAASLFEFTTTNDLKETPVANIKLNSNGTAVIQNLPNPTVDLIKPDTGSSKIFSEIYVYI